MVRTIHQRLSHINRISTDDDFVDTNTHDQPSQAAVEMSSNYRFSVESDASDLERVAQSYAEKARQQLRAKDDEVAAGTHVDRMVCRMTGSPDIWLIRVKVRSTDNHEQLTENT